MPAMVADGAPGSRTTIPPLFPAAHGRCLVLPETPGVEVNPEIEYGPERVPSRWLVAGVGVLGAAVSVLAVVGLAVIA